jgi:hypothetical protein
VEGEIDIVPPLNYKELKERPEFSDLRPRSERYDAVVQTLRAERETDEGVLTSLAGAKIVPALEESYRAYNLVEHVQKIIDAFPGHTFLGHFDCNTEGEYLWRVIIRDGKAMKVEPQIIWPEGD